MKSTYPLLTAALFVLLFTSCDDEKGIQEIELTLTTVPFDRIRLETSADIRIIQSNDHKVVIRGMERDVHDVDVEVTNDRLRIEEHGVQHGEVVIEIFVDEISELESIGSSQVYGESFFTTSTNMDITLSGSGEIDFAVETNDLDVVLEGSGIIFLEGIVQTLDADIEGSGWIRSFDLSSELTDVRIEGSGSAEVSVEIDLDVFITGSGDVYFKGHPSVNSQITGTGEVIDAN